MWAFLLLRHPLIIFLATWLWLENKHLYHLFAERLQEREFLLLALPNKQLFYSQRYDNSYHYPKPEIKMPTALLLGKARRTEYLPGRLYVK